MKIDVSASPIIAAVKSEEQLSAALKSDCEVIFLLFGDILNIAGLAERIVLAKKKAVVHIDLVNGLANKEIAADFIAKTTAACGIISTRPAIIKRANELGLFTVLRVFAIDSKALSNLAKETEMSSPDVVELLPGLMPGIIRKVSAECSVPVIAGGLLSEKSDIIAALDAGAAAVSTTDKNCWSM